MAWLSGWKYSKKITIPEASIDADIVNFPVTVALNSSPVLTLTGTATNVALNKTVTYSGTSEGGSPSRIVDGDTATANYHGFSPGNVYVQVDFGAAYAITETKVWHYYGDARTYNGTRTQLSENGIDWIDIFNSATSGTYVETSAGKVITLSTPIVARYMRDWLNGSNANTSSHWVEMQASGSSYSFSVPFDSSKCKSDFSDIRFTDAALNPLKFEKRDIISTASSNLLTTSLSLLEQGTAVWGYIWTPSSAYDNNTSTAFAASPTNDTHIGRGFTVTFTSAKKVNNININGYFLRITQLKVEYYDGSTWVQQGLYATTGGLTQIVLNNTTISSTKWRVTTSAENSAVANEYWYELFMGEAPTIMGLVYNVNVPVISSTVDTDFYLWYGNPDAYNTSIEAWQDQTGKALAYNGNVKLTPNLGKFNYAGYFGASNYLTVPHSTDFEFGSGDFSIDCWVYPLAFGSTMFIATEHSYGTLGSYYLYVDTTGKLVTSLYWTGSNAIQLLSDQSMVLNAWNHVYVGKQGTTMYLGLNGIIKSAAFTNTLVNPGVVFTIGQQTNNTYRFNGYMDEFRISKGIARWTANYAMPQTAYTVDSYTKLLLHFDTYPIIDECGKTVTPFAVMPLYKTAYADGARSAYFDGSGDFFTVTKTNSDLDLGSGNFCIEWWEFVTSTTCGTRFNTSKTASSNGGLMIGWWDTSVNKPTLYCSSNGSTWDIFSNAQALSNTLNEWVHWALVREGNIWSTYRNGIKFWTATASGTIYNSSSLPLGIGIHSDGGNASGFFTGYMGGMRITKGIPRYSSNFTPPSLAYGADQGSVDSNTRLLLHFNGTDGSTVFTDECKKTVTRYGNAQISTTQSKFGGTSAYFDGTGDCIIVPSSTDFDFGNEDFTVDFWCYLVSNTSGWLFDRRNTVTPYTTVGLLLNNGNLRIVYASGTASYEIDSTGTTLLATNTWTHIAVVRSGTQLKTYINGVVDLSKTTSSTIRTLNESFVIGASAADGSSPNLNGYIDEFRILKGIAAWTSNFTPPSQPHESGQGSIDRNTRLLLHFDGANGSTTFTDEIGKAVTRYGNAQISTAQYKFGGASGSFDGTGDYLTLADSSDWDITNEDYTWEIGWVRLNTVAAEQIFFWHHQDTSNFTFAEFDAASGARFGIYRGGSYLIDIKQGSTAGWATNTWYHIAVVKSGTIYTLYKDGIDVARGTYGSVPAALSGTMYLFSDYNAARYLNGYVDELRFSQGIARWTSNFTPPKSFAIDSNNVVFCTSFDTIYDSSYVMVQHMGDNFIDATGNGFNGTPTGTTQINTSYGKARSFNGTSDRIALPAGAIATGTAVSFMFLIQGDAAKLPTNTSFVEARNGTTTGSRTLNIHIPWSDGTIYLDCGGTGSAYDRISKAATVAEYEGNWKVWEATKDSYIGSLKMYQDGVLWSSGTGLTTQMIASNYIMLGSGITDGTTGTPTNFWPGLAAEVRSSKIMRSDAWIKAEALSVKNALVAMVDLKASAGSLFFGMNF